MDLRLRRVDHPQAHDHFRVILKEGDETDSAIGSIGIQRASGGTVHWAWAIDTVIPAREIETRGVGQDRDDCMRQFRAAWERFCADPKRLSDFLRQKRKA